MNDGRRAILIDKESLTYFAGEKDCSLTVVDLGYTFIRDCVEGDLQPGQIIIVRPTKDQVPNVDEQVHYYWEIVKGD